VRIRLDLPAQLPARRTGVRQGPVMSPMLASHWKFAIEKARTKRFPVMPSDRPRANDAIHGGLDTCTGITMLVQAVVLLHEFGAKSGPGIRLHRMATRFARGMPYA
jgi:hypothetical protein